MSGKIRKGRKSVFREIGLDDDEENVQHSDGTSSIGTQSSEEKEIRETTNRPSKSTPSSCERKNSVEEQSPREKSRWLSRLIPEKSPKIRAAATAPPTMAGIHKFTMIALLIAVILPAIKYNNGRQKIEISGVDAGVIREPIVRSVLEDRANSPTDVCKRWAGQSKHCVHAN
jgi:hypothetical protein